MSIEEQALDLALIGNCRIAALENPTGRIVWWCFPRFDSDPVFSRLFASDDEKGFCDVLWQRRPGASQMFVDERLRRMGDDTLFKRLEPVGDRVFQTALKPDAGIWEYRGRKRIHTYSAALWGNFPQTYSMAGIINVATRLSERWEDVWCRVSS